MTARTVLVCGMFGSASTWAYNASIGLLRASVSCMAGFAAALDADVVPPNVPDGAALVLKNHGWGNPAAFVDRRPEVRCIVTVRDPRDAVTSLMKRFSYDYRTALHYAAAGAGGVVAVARRTERSMTLRYEAGFMDDVETVRKTAAFLNLSPPDGHAAAVFASLRPEAVRAAVAAAERDGRFPKGLPPGETADPATQWHPNHIGERTPGQYARFLSEDRQREIMTAMPEYCAFFGYGP